MQQGGTLRQDALHFVANFRDRVGNFHRCVLRGRRDYVLIVYVWGSVLPSDDWPMSLVCVAVEDGGLEELVCL